MWYPCAAQTDDYRTVGRRVALDGQLTRRRSRGGRIELHIQCNRQARIQGHRERGPDIVKPVPLNVPELMVTGAVPVEVNVTCSVDAVFTVTSPLHGQMSLPSGYQNPSIPAVRGKSITERALPTIFRLEEWDR